jgi:tight adherence protein B
MILIATLGVLLSGLPCLLLSVCRERRNRLMSQQLRLSLQGMVHSLQVGTSFFQALERVSRECDEPLAQEWRVVRQSVQLGTPLHQALEDLARRVPLREMNWFVTAVQISQQTGGSLSGVLQTLVETLQERETLREKVAALAAQGKASGIVLGTLPFLLMGALSLIAPELLRPLFSTQIGQMMLSGVIILVATGGLVIFRIVSIRTD